MNLEKVKIESPFGDLTLVASDKALLYLCWKEDIRSASINLKEIPLNPRNQILKESVLQLKKYFTGKLKSFDLPLAPHGTEFQKRSWRELQRIPYGETISYGEQAKRIGKSKASRAVGAANGKNPIGIIIPCHRVIGHSGSLTGFGGGLSNKKKLLELEKLNPK